MFDDVIMGKAGGYSPRNVNISVSNSFTTDDSLAISTYNTNVFCEVGTGVVPVYGNLSNIPLNLPDRTMIMVTDAAYPSKARQINANFRLKYYPVLGSNPIGKSGGVGIIPWGYLLAVIVTGIVIGAVLCIVRNVILAWLLPGGVSGQERMITDTKKLITYPDGSWAVYDTDTGEVEDEGEKPDYTTDIIITILLGVAGIAGIYVFVKYGVPYLAKAFKGFGKPG